MKSIRRTLLLNVLLLLSVTLGFVSYFVYRTSEGALRERQRSARELQELRHSDRQDELLRARAEELAGDVQWNWNWDKSRRLFIAQAASAAFAPTAPLSGPSLAVTVGTSLPNPVSMDVNARAVTQIRLDEESADSPTAIPPHEYVQLSGDPGTLWSSRSLASHRLPIEPGTPGDPEATSSRFDTLALPDGTEVRRLVMRKPVTRFRYERWATPRNEEPVSPSRAVVGLASVARSSERRGPPPSTGFVRPRGNTPGGYDLPTFTLQCAWSLSADNPKLTEIIADRDVRLAAIDAETEASVRHLRSTLAWTVAGAVGATLFGGWFLVGLGLFPLKRLSDAVSQITPKDLTLPIEPEALPSELRPVTAKLVQALAELQQAFDREKRATADISHELRTPLAALTTTLEVGCRKTRTVEQYQQMLGDCRGIAKQMSALVERMLTMAWIDADVDRVRPESVDVGELLAGVTAIGRPLAESRGLTFGVRVPASIRLTTDPGKLREVVMNLVHNAVEYNRPGGAVEVSADATPRGVMVEVRDTGIGMAPDIRDKVFERFFRGDPSRHSTDAHAGLGLAIVKEYVDRLGGTLSVDSEVGVGSRFRIELPQAT